MNPLTRKTLLAGLLGSGARAACAPQAGSPTLPAPADSSSAATAITHVHAITRDRATGLILLATHHGLFRVKNQELTRVGPLIDLMGFTVTREGRCLASGHPGSGTDLPEPVGLIESTDAGNTTDQLL